MEKSSDEETFSLTKEGYKISKSKDNKKQTAFYTYPHNILPPSTQPSSAEPQLMPRPQLQIVTYQTPALQPEPEAPNGSRCKRTASTEGSAAL